VSSIIARRRHPAAGYAAVAGGLVAAGVLYSTLSGGGASAAATATESTQVAQGHSLFVASCSACHGLDAQGTTQAPSLIGAGAAAVDFQMSTGRMPAKELGAENERKPTDFTQSQIYDIAAYVASLGGGPAIPSSEQVSTAGANTGLGSELFSTNCKNAPSLTASTPTQIYEAMLTGPEAMPVFGDGTITPAEKKDIIGYVIDTRNEANPGGFSLGRTGTVTEGLLGWLGGLGFLVIIAMWLTAKRRDSHAKAESEQHS
jgi:ubiquinol-cytochrome c reductase cytochrome c subunit